MTRSTAGQESRAVTGCALVPVCLWKKAQQLSRCLRDGRRDSRKEPRVDEAPIAIATPETDSRFIRWQETRIAQFGFANNVVLVLTAPSVGFALDKAPEFSGVSKCFLFIGVLVLILSGASALLCTYTRLLDFKLTAQIAATKKEIARANKHGGATVEKLEKLVCRSRATCDHLGDESWCYIELQMLLFGIGATIIAIVVFFRN